MKAPWHGTKQLPAGATLLTGIVTALLFVAHAAVAGETPWPSLLCAWLFFLGLSLGSLTLICMHELTGGDWGRTVRPVFDAAARLLPLSVLFGLPLLLHLSDLYPWLRTPAPIPTAAAGMKTAYLSEDFFIVRALLYFAIWLTLVWLLRPRPPGQAASEAARRRIAAGGFILLGLSITFSHVDWVMSLTPQWLSTAYGLLAGVGMALAALAEAVAIAAWRGGGGDLPDRCHDLGNLLLTLVLVWAYLAFMQYLIIWMEDLPDDISWFLPRLQTSWRSLAAIVVVFHFLLPFAALLSRRVKRSPRLMLGLASVLLLACVADTFWEVMPTLRPQGLAFGWNDLLALLGLGGIWCGLLLRRLNGPRRGAPLRESWLAGASDG